MEGGESEIGTVVTLSTSHTYTVIQCAITRLSDRSDGSNSRTSKDAINISVIYLDHQMDRTDQRLTIKIGLSVHDHWYLHDIE